MYLIAYGFSLVFIDKPSFIKNILLIETKASKHDFVVQIVVQIKKPLKTKCRKWLILKLPLQDLNLRPSD